MNIIYTEKKVEPHKIEEKFPINNARDKDEKKTSTIIDRDSGTPEEIENSIRGIDLFDTGEKTYILYYPEEYLAIPIIEIIIKEYKGTVVTRELAIKETFSHAKDYIPEREKEEGLIFELTNALEMRDKKKIWLTYKKLRNNNKDDEEILPILLWWIKNIHLVKKIGSTNGLIHSFPEGKIKKACILYTLEEIQNMHKKILGLSQSYAEKNHYEGELELFLLNI